MVTTFYSEQELSQLGLNTYGSNVQISRKASIFCPEKISIGDNVRIDDFCILSGSITLGSNIHISAFCALYGSHGITMQDYSGLSARTIIYSAMDDFSGDYLIGPIHPKELTHVVGGPVLIERYVQVGVNCVIYPGLVLPEGCVIGAMTLVNRPIEPWSIYVGIPARKLKDREKGLLDKLKAFYEEK